MTQHSNGDYGGMQEASSNESVEALILEEIASLEKKIDMWRKNSGYSGEFCRLRDGLGLSPGEICYRGDQRESIIYATDNLGLGATLLLGVAINLVVNPPAAIRDLDKDDWKREAHLYAWVFAFSSCLGLIAYTKMFADSVLQATRESDVVRVQMPRYRSRYAQLTAVQEQRWLLFMIVFCSGFGVYVDIFVVYGKKDATVSSVIILFVLSGCILSAYHYMRRTADPRSPELHYLMSRINSKKEEYEAVTKKARD